MPDLSGRTALITGGSGGLGTAIARQLAENGCAVAIHCHDNEETAQATSSSILARGGVAAVVVADLSNREGCESVVEKTEAVLGAIDIVVLAAGVAGGGLTVALDPRGAEHTVAVNLMAPLHIASLTCGSMMRRRFGRLVALSSPVAAVGGQRGQLCYAATKGGLEAMIRTLALEISREGIDFTANAVAPGIVPTGLSRRGIDEMNSQLLASVPAGRFGAPDEVASLVHFLCGPNGSYINGTVINIDGGYALKSLPNPRSQRRAATMREVDP